MRKGRKRDRETLKAKRKGLTDLLDGDDLLCVVVHALIDRAERAGAELLEDGVLTRRVIAGHHWYGWG